MRLEDQRGDAATREDTAEPVELGRDARRRQLRQPDQPAAVAAREAHPALPEALAEVRELLPRGASRTQGERDLARILRHPVLPRLRIDSRHEELDIAILIRKERVAHLPEPRHAARGRTHDPFRLVLRELERVHLREVGGFVASRRAWRAVVRLRREQSESCPDEGHRRVRVTEDLVRVGEREFEWPGEAWSQLRV